MTTLKDGTTRTEIGQLNMISVAMEDLLEVERAALEKELQEEMATARRRKLTCFQKTCTGVIKKAARTIMTTAPTTTTSKLTPNMTPEELVKFIDVVVASKNGNNLSNVTRVITDDVRSTLESYKTDQQNNLPRQLRLVVQEV
jgi:hypothetical protein